MFSKDWYVHVIVFSFLSFFSFINLYSTEAQFYDNSTEITKKSGDFTVLPDKPILTYIDKEIGFKIDYPSNWGVNEGIGEYFIATFDSPDYEAGVGIKIMPQDPSKPKSLKDFGEVIKQDNDIMILEYYRNSTTLLSGQPAIKTIFLNDEYSKVLLYVTLADSIDAFYVLTYHASPKMFSIYLDEVEKMINSFKILKTESIFHED